AVSPAQLRYAPIPSVVVRQHPNSLFHPTSLCKRHRQVPLRCKLTCRPSTRAKLSTIYPVRTRPFRTRSNPPPRTPPHHSATLRGGGEPQRRAPLTNQTHDRAHIALC